MNSGYIKQLQIILDILSKQVTSQLYFWKYFSVNTFHLQSLILLSSLLLFKKLSLSLSLSLYIYIYIYIKLLLSPKHYLSTLYVLYIWFVIFYSLSCELFRNLSISIVFRNFTISDMPWWKAVFIHCVWP